MYVRQGARVSETAKNRTLYSSNTFYHCVYGGGRSLVQVQFGIPQQLNKTTGVKLDGAGVIISKLLVPLLVPLMVPLLVPDSSSC